MPRYGDLMGRRLSRRQTLAAAGFATASGAVSACGGAKRTANRSQGAAAGKPVYGGQISFAISYDTPSYDPAISSNPNQTAQVLGFVGDSLLLCKAGPDISYNAITLEPWLAERWESPDAQTYTLHLRRGVNFANLPPANGRPVTSADVRWSYEYLTRLGDLATLPPSIKAGLFQGLQRVDTPDDATVVMHFAQPFAPFPTYAASVFSSILPHEIVDEDGDFNRRIVGTGAWQLDPSASQKGSREVYKRNTAYFDSGRPYIDQVNRLILPDNGTANAAFQTKRLDTLDYVGLDYTTTEQMKKLVPSAVVYNYLDPGPGQFYINATKPPLNDLRIRRAIALSVDRDELMRALAGGNGEWAPAGALPGMFTHDETRQMLPHDPAQARQLVASAGYANGVDVELMYPEAKYGNAGLTEYQLLQSQLKQGGVNLALKSVDQTDEGIRKHNNDFQLDYTGVDVQNDPDDYLYGYFHPKSGHNYTKVNDPELTPLLEAQRREVDLDKRRDLWRQAVRRINDQVWAISFHFLQRSQLWWPHLVNYAPNWGRQAQPIVNSWLRS